MAIFGKYLSNPAALLQSLVVENHGTHWQNVRRLQCVGINHVVRMDRGF
jgi:hypothetical protein